jgi:hypothetical protein
LGDKNDKDDLLLRDAILRCTNHKPIVVYLDKIHEKLIHNWVKLAGKYQILLRIIGVVGQAEGVLKNTLS